RCDSSTLKGTAFLSFHFKSCCLSPSLQGSVSIIWIADFAEASGMASDIFIDLASVLAIADFMAVTKSGTEAMLGFVKDGTMRPWGKGITANRSITFDRFESSR